MDQEKLFSVIRGFGYTTSGQTSEIVEAILANSAPNKALVEALQSFMKLGHSYSYNDIQEAQKEARAALNAAGVEA